MTTSTALMLGLMPSSSVASDRSGLGAASWGSFFSEKCRSMVNLAGLGEERKHAGRVLGAYRKHGCCHPVAFEGRPVPSLSISVFNRLDRVQEKPTGLLCHFLTYIKQHKRETFFTFCGNQGHITPKAETGTSSRMINYGDARTFCSHLQPLRPCQEDIRRANKRLSFSLGDCSEPRARRPTRLAAYGDRCPSPIIY